LLRVVNENDPITAGPREITTLCCFTGLTTLSLIFNQGLFLRKAGMELKLMENDKGIAFYHPKVRNVDLFVFDIIKLFFLKDTTMTIYWILFVPRSSHLYFYYDHYFLCHAP
jgi:hypothetical protein